MSIASDIQSAISAFATMPGMVQPAGEFIQPIMPGPRRSVWELGEKIRAGKGEETDFLDLDLRHPGEQASLEPAAIGPGLIIGDVRIWLPMQKGGEESIIKELELARHPQEDRKRVTDHAWRNPFTFTISGALVDDDRSGKHRRALDRLHQYQENAELVPLFIDFKGVVGDCLVKSVRATRSTFQNTYYVTIEVEQVYFIGQAGSLRTLSQRDASNGMTPEDRPVDMLNLDPQVWGVPAASRKQQGDGGIGGFFNKMLSIISNFSDTALGRLAINALRDTVGKSPLGQIGLAAFDVLTGNQTSTLTKAVNVGLNLLQGKATFGDVANAALDIIPGASNLRDALTGPVSKALGFVESLPFGKQVVKAASEILGGQDVTKVALKYAGNVVQQIGREVPALGDITMVVGGWLGAH